MKLLDAALGFVTELVRHDECSKKEPNKKKQLVVKLIKIYALQNRHILACLHR
jgi:hypothetical protein